MTTTYTILRADGRQEQGRAELPAMPDLEQIRAIVQPVIGAGNWLERVAVLHNGQATDMFVDEDGHLRGLPVNIEATKVYRANWLARHPEANPDTLALIVGDAVLFDRRVWF